MAFKIPNLSDAYNELQAAPDSRDFEILVNGLLGNGVVSGCAAHTEQGTPNMTVPVASGQVKINNTLVDVIAGNVTITTAHSTNPRFDLIVVNDSGTKSVVAGTASDPETASPVFPAIPADSVVLSAVFVGAGVTAIETEHIIDKRVFVPLISFAGVETITGIESIQDVALIDCIVNGSNSVASQAYVDSAVSGAGGGIPSKYFESGWWYSSDVSGGIAAFTPTLNVVYYQPFTVPETITLDRIGVRVSTAGATSVSRLAIFERSGGKPGDLITDFGTVSNASVGAPSITISQALPADKYWFGAAIQVATAGLYAKGSIGDPQIGYVDPNSYGLINNATLIQTGVSGAMPSTANPTSNATQGINVYVRIV